MFLRAASRTPSSPIDALLIRLSVRGTGAVRDEGAYRDMSVAHNPYGDGKACGRIVQALADFASAP
ncbi:hypothetical protein CXG45_24610 [Pseudomonas plecoglossicida]|uniref:UDP-N-acetylglucosamine 2-epimerase n=1 Tax=Pseudomonas plecoglossicida TaxID=70775 RepID=A0ABX4TUG6_PSEDL|nr:hypothetical protein CXG44_22465 [Pseudomonas plecoglossicida]PLU90083.1 hypothetical protein CXG45_24610 [Pseudomonas plecoglossicida]PLU97156.1 hypothetical protein CXG48_27840 [Pseudomonas plecoglossicida]PLV08958.1 hypothetical protein CXG47_24880 [Pseudomonas plecoglossicida]